MKKILSLILALALALSLSVTAFAADSSATNDGTAGTSIAVTGRYTAVRKDVIAVTVVWDAMTFEYKETKTWDPDNKQYTSTGTWGDNDSGTITLTNHSNVPVNATFSFTKADENESNNNASIAFIFENSPLTDGTVRLHGHPNADSTNTGLDHIKTVDAKASGSLGSGWTEGSLGTITVSIAQANE